jgi:glycosyltransferase involved in cell wall biosynthesis
MVMKLSIVIPTLNEEDRLPNLLNDLRSQTFNNFEIIVVDAKSPDKTQEIARKFRAKVIVSGKKNVAYQRNLGAKASKSEFIIFMDADDRITKTFLQKIIGYLERNSPDILSTWIKPDSRDKKDKFAATVMNIFMEINKNAKKPYMLESMMAVKRESFIDLRGFNPKIAWGEGNEMIERANKLGMIYTFLKNPKYTHSFRRIRKVGTFTSLQNTSQMEIIKLFKGKLTKENIAKLYPMEGGSFYKIDIKDRKLIQNLFKKSFNSWKSFFG